MSRRKIKRKITKAQQALRDVKKLNKQKDLLDLIQEGLEVEDLMEETGLDVMELTEELSSIYETYKKFL